MTIQELQQWASTDVSRDLISSPWRVGEWVFATDGMALIRVPATAEHDGMRSDGPAVDRLLFQGALAVTPVVLPDGWRDVPKRERECGNCDGSGRMGECQDCDGLGVRFCDYCECSSDCRGCRGKGYVCGDAGLPVCEDCGGTGVLVDYPKICLNRGEVFINLRWLERIMALPGARLFVQSPFVDAFSPNRFVFDGGDGLWQPMRVRDDERAALIEQQWGAVI